MPIYKKGLVHFFQSNAGRSALQMDINGNNTIDGIIWGNTFGIETIFDRGNTGVQHRHVIGHFP